MKTFKNIFSAAILSAALPCAYAAGLPQSAVLHYSGSYGIPATMTFERSGNAYKIVSTIKVPLYQQPFRVTAVRLSTIPCTLPTIETCAGANCMRKPNSPTAA